MTDHDFYDRIKGVFQKKAESDKRIQSILKRIESGKATFADTAEYSQLVSELLGSTLSEHLGVETTAYVKEYVCREMLRDQYESMNDLLASVQRALNEKVGLRVAPQRAAFPTERVNVIAHALEDPTVPIDVIKRRAKSPVANVSKSFHDDYIKENARFRSRAGLKCFIVRTTDGKCCDWCTAMAGQYVNGEEPAGFWNRHDNCGCTIYYNTSRARQTLRGEGKKWNVIDEVPRKFVPKRFDRKEAKTLEQAKLSQYRGLTSGANGGIIRNIRIDDFRSAVAGGRINEDVIQVIFDALSETNGQYLFDDVVVIKTESNVVMQTDPVRKGTFFDTRLNLNENFLGGKTVEKLNTELYNTDYTVANTLREAAIHEKYHAKLINGLNQAQLEALYDELSEIHIDGISPTAWKDGSECIAEVGVLFERGETSNLPQRAIDLFNKYIGGII